MAKDETQNSAPQPRVYKSNAVHKRRTGKAVSARGKNSDVDVLSEAAADAAIGHKVEGAEEPANDVVDSHPEPLPEQDGEAVDEQVGASSATVSVKPSDPADEALFADEGERSEEVDGDSEHAPEEDVADEEGASVRRKRKTEPRTLAKRVVLVLIALLVIVAVALASYFAWDRWGRYDDAADIQGQWYIDGTAAPIIIDAQTMQLADNVAYSYEIDPQEKTIRFSFGSWKGQGRYRFSDDRQRLLIMDGEYSGVGNLLDDLFTPFDAMVSAGVQQPTATLQESPDAASTSAPGAAPASGGSAPESGQAVPSEQTAASPEQTDASSGQVVGSSEQANVVSGQGVGQELETPGLGQGVSLFNRQADPVALKAKEEAEKAAQAQAEREAKAAAEAEAAEAAEYGYYDEYYEYDESSEDTAEEEGAGEGDQVYSEDEEGWA